MAHHDHHHAPAAGRRHHHDHDGHETGGARGQGRHNHHHHHHHGGFGLAFALGAGLNIGFVALEAVFGILGNSMALLADAGHNLSDVLALLAAWGATALSSRKPSARFTYGLGSTSVLAALFNAVVLLVVTGGIAGQAIQRLITPERSAGVTVMAVAAAGIVVNGLTAALFASGRKGDLNVRSAFLHMLSDALVSAGVVVAGGLMLLTGWLRIDPAASLIISALIVWATWSLLRDSLRMALHGVPPGIEPAEVRAFLEGLPGVDRLHDLHIWPMSTTETALTCHLFMPAGHPSDSFLAEVSHDLHDRFGIGHATLQVEIDAAYACPLEPEHVI